MLGTNPIAIAAPAGRFDAFCLDMATSTVPRGRIEVAARRGWSLPVGWAIDADGNPATTPEAALAGALHPLGGEEATGGHKGYGLALVVDLLTGILGGAAFGPNIVGLFSTEAPADLGQTFIAIDPSALGEPGAFEAAGGLPRPARRRADRARRARPGAHPGRSRRRTRSGWPQERGVVIDADHHESLSRLGERMGIPLPVQHAGAGMTGAAAPRSMSCIVGGGIVGLATALRLLEARPGPADRGPREGTDARVAPDGAQQRRAPCGPVLPARAR